MDAFTKVLPSILLHHKQKAGAFLLASDSHCRGVDRLTVKNKHHCCQLSLVIGGANMTHFLRT